MIKTRIIKAPASPRAKKIAEAPADKAFWINHGPVVRTLSGLHTALLSMTDAQFDYHTRRSGNDFEKWIRDVLGNKPAATAIAKAKNRKDAADAIAKF